MISLNDELTLADHEMVADRWDAFVESHSKGTIFHSSPMLEVFRSTPKHQVFAHAAIDSQDRILALLFSVRVATLAGVASPLASRAIMYSEPICEDSSAGRRALKQLLGVHDEFMRRRTLFSEIRLIADAGSIGEPLESSGYQHVDFLNFVVDLSQPEEQLWQNIGKSTRGKIRRSARRGVEIEFAANEQTVARVYRLIRTSFQRSRIPLADISLLQNALRLLPPGVVQIRIATHQGRDVAGTIGLCHRNRFFAWYGGTTRAPGIDPFAALVWDEIRWSHQNGIRFYDFGGAGSPHQDYGPRIFKSRFHGDLINHGRYRKVYSAKRLALAEKGFQSLNAFFGAGSGDRN